MKNKKISIYLIISILIVLIFTLISIKEYHTYTANYNIKISKIISTLKENYPNITDEEILDILKSNNDTNYMKRYGYNQYKDNYIKVNNNTYIIFLIINITYIVLSLSVLIIIFFKHNKKTNKEIDRIIKLIEDINNKKYELHIEESSEDIFSKLKTEIYKTTIVLKEAAENSNNDKKELKKSLEDISHQLKTPLTSILVMLDNIIDEPEMDNEIKIEFINDIKREIMNINFLVQNILKLSKLDSNTIVFNKNNYKIIEILEQVAKNVNTLCDLKDVNINIKGNIESNLYCDKKWEIEAITNIVKNCVEHSNINTVVDINYNENKVYSLIEVIDYGKPINKKDLPHIFERFYTSDNSKEDSIGIGLALSKSIIEEDNGSIFIKSNDKSTRFIIKYYK